MVINADLLRAARGVWPFDWEPLQMGVEDGIVWAICPGRMGGVNGYVLIPAEGHPWSNRANFPDTGTYDLDDLLDVHGGLTYANHPWIGFDTLHAFDYWPPEHDPHGIAAHTGELRGKMGLHVKRWTVDMVVDEAKCLARQVATGPG